MHAWPLGLAQSASINLEKIRVLYKLQCHLKLLYLACNNGGVKWLNHSMQRHWV